MSTSPSSARHLKKCVLWRHSSISLGAGLFAEAKGKNKSGGRGHCGTVLARRLVDGVEIREVQ